MCGYKAFEDFLESVYMVDPKGYHVVIEIPRDYPGEKRECDPNDLITLALRAGRIGARFEVMGCTVEYIYPQDWKGSTPKDISNARTLKKANAKETQLIYSTKSTRAKKPNHNMLDAIGIGFWKVSLYEVFRVGRARAQEESG